MPIKVAIVGYGNIGKAVFEAVESAADMEPAGIIRRDENAERPPELARTTIVNNVDKLSEKPDVAIICSPSRLVRDTAIPYLEKGICTVDSFDIHSGILELKNTLSPVCKKHGAVSIISAGWDPGSDSVVRALLLAMAPKGVTYTNFGPGMSMGHTVAVKSKEGVKNALSVTIPTGTGIHRRMVYVELCDGALLDDVAKSIKSDPYFSHDETVVTQVSDVSALLDMGHGVNIVRKGVSGKTHNQLLEFNMKINNPALTAQILVSSVRAAKRQAPGCYTTIEIPPIDYLEGDRDEIIRELV